ncbi:MAG: cobalt-zinc-cadmium efflux system membrane fusion protein [Planctomycetota bacterium]|jgi:multidrug efflux pump subunit AcrA (membrane-fusion protein)
MSLALLLASGCDSHQKLSVAKVVPATLHRVAEQNLTEITLSKKAHQRLGIRTEPAIREACGRTRTMGGEIVLPPHAEIIVTAPFAGTIQSKQALPAVGSSLTSAQEIFWLTPLSDPVTAMTLARGLTEASGEIQKAETAQKAALVVLKRADELLADGAGSQEAVDSAQSAMDVATTTVRVTQERAKALADSMDDIEDGTRKPTIVRSPLAGILKDVRVAVGQAVASGAPLFTITDPRLVWVRVPVYLGILNDVDVARAVEVGDLGMRPGQAIREAMPIAAPPTANALAATADLYYALDNTASASKNNDSNLPLRPGQRVAVTVPLKSEQQSLTVPWQAVVHDVDGGTWVYVETAALTYRRSRIELLRVQDGKAVLGRGPAAGSKIVTDGAAELFGTEFGEGR